MKSDSRKITRLDSEELLAMAGEELQMKEA
jgi:hypothetical protein